MIWCKYMTVMMSSDSPNNLNLSAVAVLLLLLLLHPAVVLLQFADLQNLTKDKNAITPTPPLSWIPPPQGRYKLNTDGSWKDNKAAGGGVIRRDDGNCIAGLSIKLKAADAQEAEVLALRFGLFLIKSLDIDRFDVEVDALDIQKIITSTNDFTGHKLAPILRDIAAFLQEYDHMVLLHVPRNCNRVAHGLAEFGMKMRRGKVFHSLPPTFVEDIYNKEVAADYV